MASNDLKRFNDFLAGQEQQEKQKRRVQRAEQAKEKAAEHVRRTEARADATREEKEEAKQAYLDATEAWRLEREGKAPADPEAATDADRTDEVTAEATSDEAPAVADAAPEGEGKAETVPAEDDQAGNDAAAAEPADS